jgi:hypothetical protein
MRSDSLVPLQLAIRHADRQRNRPGMCVSRDVRDRFFEKKEETSPCLRIELHMIECGRRRVAPANAAPGQQIVGVLPNASKHTRQIVAPWIDGPHDVAERSTRTRTTDSAWSHGPSRRGGYCTVVSIRPASERCTVELGSRALHSCGACCAAQGERLRVSLRAAEKRSCAARLTMASAPVMIRTTAGIGSATR